MALGHGSREDAAAGARGHGIDGSRAGGARRRGHGRSLGLDLHLGLDTGGGTESHDERENTDHFDSVGKKVEMKVVMTTVLLAIS